MRGSVRNLVLLSAHGLDVLGGDDRVLVDRALLDTDVRLGVSIELLGLVGEVEVERVRPSECDCGLISILVCAGAEQ